jgi:hypothetical protein
MSRIFKHGHAGHSRQKAHPLYARWQSMKRRCYNKKDKSYERYGARGITVCKEWESDYLNFYNWAITHGYKQDLQIDRRKNDKDYSPDNCRFVNGTVNCNNKRNNRRITYKGITKNLGEWAVFLGMPLETLSARLNRRKWIVDRAFTTPARRMKLRNKDEYGEA